MNIFSLVTLIFWVFRPYIIRGDNSRANGHNNDR